LNSAGFSSTQLVRLKPDPQGLTLPEKQGGWQRYYNVPVAAKVTALWPWEDLNANKWVAFGTSSRLTGPLAGQAQLGVLNAVFNPTTGLYTASTLQDITPPATFDDVPPVFQTVKGSAVVEITDNTTMGITNYDAVYITTPVSAGGLILFGLYQCSASASNEYSVVATDILGNPTPAVYTTSASIAITSGSSSGTQITVGFSAIASANVPPAGEAVTFASVTPSAWNGTWIVISATTTQIVVASTAPAASWSSGGTISNTGVLRKFTTTNASSIVTVTFPDHGQLVGNSVASLAATTVGGITLQGDYTVLTVPDAHTYTIQTSTAATSGASAYENSGNVHNIFSISAGPQPPAFGYGGGGYGLGGYGIGQPFVTPASGTPIGAGNWTLDNWGELLIACPETSSTGSVQFQPVYAWDPTSGASTATVIPNAPTVNDGILVAMPQRQIVAWGSTQTGIQDPLLIQWCDVNNFEVWAAQVTNQAGSYRIPTGSKIVRCIQAPQQILVFTDLNVWAMQYTGPQYIYGFNQLGAGCGLIAKKAVGILSGVTYWMSRSQFFCLSSAGVTPLPCPIWDVIFQNLNAGEIDQIVCAVNSMFQEVSWYWPVQSDTGDIVTMYVRYNALIEETTQNPMAAWDFGTLTRTAWTDVSVVGPPLGADQNFVIFQHEISPDADGQAMMPSVTTGYFALAEGDQKVTVDQIWPDFKYGYSGAPTQGATVQMTFNGVDYPWDTPTVYGPYTITQGTEFISPRIRNRLLSVTVSSSDVGTFWRWGGTRYRLQSDGRY